MAVKSQLEAALRARPKVVQRDQPVRRKRGSMDLLADMLECSRGGARQTAIMYRANLSYDVLKQYLPLLLSKNLLEERDENGMFKPSSKGLRFIREYRKYGRLRDSMVQKRLLIESFVE